VQPVEPRATVQLARLWVTGAPLAEGAGTAARADPDQPDDAVPLDFAPPEAVVGEETDTDAAGAALSGRARALSSVKPPVSPTKLPSATARVTILAR
jgi:hypothetical protein